MGEVKFCWDFSQSFENCKRIEMLKNWFIQFLQEKSSFV